MLILCGMIPDFLVFRALLMDRARTIAEAGVTTSPSGFAAANASEPPGEQGAESSILGQSNSGTSKNKETSSTSRTGQASSGFTGVGGQSTPSSEDQTSGDEGFHVKDDAETNYLFPSL